MQPLSATEVAAVQKDRPEVTDEHVQELENLAAAYFLENPHLPQSAEDKQRIADRQGRMRALHQLIFAPKPPEP